MPRTPEHILVKARVQAARYRSEHPDEVRAAVRAWREVNREKDREAAKRWGRENPEQKKANNRRHAYMTKYGITPEDYDAMLAAQQGVCAICGQPPKPGRRLSVDHCHETNEVRALLCVGCNTGVGYFERPIRAAIEEYLARWRDV